MKEKQTTRGIRPSKNRKPSRTKKGYAFTKDYPEHTEGTFFPADPTPDKMSLKAKFLTFVAAILVFVLSFIAFSTALNLSNRTPRSEIAGTGVYEEDITVT